MRETTASIINIILTMFCCIFYCKNIYLYLLKISYVKMLKCGKSYFLIVSADMKTTVIEGPT